METNIYIYGVSQEAREYAATVANELEVTLARLKQTTVEWKNDYKISFLIQEVNKIKEEILSLEDDEKAEFSIQK